ncbi:MAG TPA: GGDEF domain-containing protein [Candidatus Sulfotelmatobacter sp.]
MDALYKSAWRSLLLPNGLLLVTVAVLLQAGWLVTPMAAVSFINYGILSMGFFLAWRFHSSRAFFALLALFVAEETVAYFAGSRLPVFGPGRAALDAISILLPLNFILISLLSDSRLTLPQLTPVGVILVVQSLSVAIFSVQTQSGATHTAHRGLNTVPLPEFAWLVFAAALVLLLIRFFWLHKPLESGLLWSLTGFFTALHFGAVGYTATVYLAAAALTISVSIIETSYLLAYHDELTSLPSRRAFNDAVAHMHAPYAIAMVDIDHFKRCNDTYGHDTGDQVLQLVAARLANVTGGGQAFRCGGEEFTIVFGGKTADEIVEHLERLRSRIEASSFLMRTYADRRHTPRGPDRRNLRGRGKTGHMIRRLTKAPSVPEISVTVSIGVASAKQENIAADAVVRAADKALYRAKSGGRNRVETENAPRRPARTRAAGIA